MFVSVFVCVCVQDKTMAELEELESLMKKDTEKKNSYIKS